MDNIEKLVNEVGENLTNNILKYWSTKMIDSRNGGFYGRISGSEQLYADADKGAILNARILWTFSAAYRILGKEEYLTIATRAKQYIIDKFYDKEFGGVYWSLNFLGKPLDTKKQIYAIGFAIYGLSEYARATGDREALDYAIKLFDSIEEHSFDKERNGYFEAMTRQWGEIADMRLSEKDANERKTMNTHLHILEPYANLYRVWKDSRLEQQLRNLIDVFITRILDKETYHLNLFFDDDWNSKYHIISYGHDIEASWLIHEAALVLDDKDLLKKVEPVIVKIAEAAAEGFTPENGMIYESNLDKHHVDRDRHWWVQAETVVGYMNIYQHFGDHKSLERALSCWNYIKNNLIDHEQGEWFWSIKANGEINRDDDKAGFWKCPYHNGRMCMEIIERFGK
ncbi:MAG TPA: AGE family epimerase/isomerase [Candidatus Barnesiella excrementigallinarum]|nr:AGE family epimerase/isomerase [Candidatus Barnesiella excrementigallinarum]